MAAPSRNREASNEDRKIAPKLNFITLAAAGLTAILGLAVLIGWYGNIPALVQVHPALVPMQFNTALGLLLCGAGLAALAAGMYRSAWVSGAAVAAIGLATLIEFATGAELGIDRLFMEPYITTKSLSPGRMAWTTACSLVLSGVALTALGACPGRREVFSGLTASLVLAVGLGTFLGYSPGTDTPYGWSSTTYMAVHTAAGFVLLGAGLFSYVLSNAMADKNAMPRWVPIPVGIILFTLSLGLWQALIGHERIQIQRETAAQAENLGAQIRQTINARIKALERMARRWERRNGMPRREWEENAYDYVTDHPDYQSIERVDSSFRVRWVVPSMGNEARMNLNLDDDGKRRVALERSAKQHNLVVTESADLAQGGKGFQVYVPLFPAGRFNGFILGVFRIENMISHMVTDAVARDYAIRILSGGVEIFRSPAKGKSTAPSWTRVRQIGFQNVTWQIRARPRPEFLSRAQSAVPGVALAAGLLVTVLSMLLINRAQTAWRRAKVIRMREERYALAVAGTNDGIWEWNIAADEVHRSPRLLQILGYEPGDLDSHLQVLTEFIHPEDTERALRARQAHIETGAPFDLEYRIRRKTGEYIWVSAKGQAAWDKEGKPLRMVGSINDITDRKQAEQALQESEKRYRGLIEGSDLGIQIGSRESGRIFANRACAELFGYDSIDELLAVPRYQLVASYDRDRATGNRKTLYGNGAAVTDYEMDAVRKDGSIFPVQVFMRRIEWEGEDAIQRTFIDLSKRRQAEQALIDSEELFRTTFEQNAVGMAIRDIDPGKPRWLRVNQKLCDILGYSREELLQMKTVDISLPEDRPISLELNQRFFRREITSHFREKRYVRKDGRKIWVNVWLTAVLDSDGDATQVIAAIQDITEQKQAEEQLRHAQKMEAVGQLTGGLAHDFNNLLATAMGNAQLLERKLAGQDDLLDMVKPIIRATRRGAELTHRLLAFSRKQPLQPETIRLDELCREMSDLLKRSLGETIGFEISADDRVWDVLADPGQLENALLNLAINASHAMAEGGKLSIGIENALVTDRAWAERWEGKPGEYVALRVADTGTGMAANVIEHVFEPFFTTKEVGQGSGLGLSMVYGFAQQSGGFTAIESEQGRGTAVTIYLPKAGAGGIAADAHAAEPEIQKSRGEIVLLVEDEADVRDITTKLLISLGYTVLAAEDGAGALEIASGSGRIDLLLSDMVLPGGMNGIEICNRIRETRPGLKCVFMSGYSTTSEEDLPEGTELLSKPVAMDELAAKTRQILG